MIKYSTLLFFASLFFFASLLQAQEGYEYEERPSVGLYYEVTSIQSQELLYREKGVDFNTSMKAGPVFGVGANLPLNSVFGINGVVGAQMIDYTMTTTRPSLPEGLDSKAEIGSFNLLVQAGIEAGIPVYTDYASQSMFKLLAYGSGIAGKNFLNGTTFRNTEVWGWAYGAALRLTWGSISVEPGVRSSLVYFNSDYDPAEASASSNAERFMMEYTSLFNPYLKATLALY